MRLIPAFATLLVGTALVARAQQPATIVRVRVIDTAGKPVANAEVTAIRGLNTILATGSTNDAGLRTLSVPRGSDDDEVVVRHIGFVRGDHFFRPDRDSLSLVVTLRVTAHDLPAVEVRAQQDLSKNAIT